MTFIISRLSGSFRLLTGVIQSRHVYLLLVFQPNINVRKLVVVENFYYFYFRLTTFLNIANDSDGVTIFSNSVPTKFVNIINM